jgi:hypothetical protein
MCFCVCRCIPKDTPGADWRVLLEIVKSDPSREKFNVSLSYASICLPFLCFMLLFVYNCLIA